MFVGSRRKFLKNLVATRPFLLSRSVLSGVQSVDVPPDGVIATESRLYGPKGVSFDPDDNLYVVDQLHLRIRRIDAKTKIITTVAGTGAKGLSGDGGPALRARLDYPSVIHVDLSGNIFFTEAIEGRVRRVDAKSRFITTVAGDGIARWNDQSKEGDLATRRSLETPGGLGSDTRGNLILSDSTRILKIDKITQRMTMLTGEARRVPPLRFPSELTLDRNDNIYFAEANTHRIWILHPDKTVETLYQTEGTISSPVLDRFGSLYFIDSNRIFQMELTTRKVSHFAGKPRTSPTSNFSGDGGLATQAGMDNPSGLAVDTHGNLYVSDWIANRIRRIDRTTRIIETIAGNGKPKHPPYAPL